MDVIDWSATSDELRAENERLKASLRYLQQAYDTLRADWDAAHKVVDFLTEYRDERA